MLYDEFQEQVERLKRVYGEKSWSEERVKLLWNRFGKEKPDAFARAIDNVISENLVSPAFSKIQESLPGGGKTIFAEEKKYDWDCSWCCQSGIISAKEIGTPYKCIFICLCEFGKKNRTREDLKEWSVLYKKHFTLIPWAEGCDESKPGKIHHKGVPVQAPIKEIATKITKSMPEKDFE